ncbi:hypothetical protein HPB50_018915 [Hyalomma asiaticum]|uniref:Uncharacterized protein n=1 Tax=Hyalomma asiaticum TaxID=266040 RepID=A0ACB7TK36_HYAAI|nr:hypothetical protein HPB50_018915 [Hyalomma asiaticum]
MSPAEYAVVLNHVLMHSLLEDLVILYHQCAHTHTGVADSADGSREGQVKEIMKFVQVEVESRGEGRLSCKNAATASTSTNRKIADIQMPPHLPYALTLAAPSSWPGVTPLPRPTACPLCGIPGHKTRNYWATLSAEEKR